MATGTFRSGWMPRPDLEEACGIAPIESAFRSIDRVMRYKHNDAYGQLEANAEEDYGQWFVREVEFCKERFKQ